MSRMQRLRQLVRLSRLARVLIGLGVFLAILSNCCLGGMLISDPPTQGELNAVHLFFLLQSFFVLPVVILFVILAAAVEKRSPPRALLWTGAAILAALAGFLLALVMISTPGEQPLATAALSLSVLAGPVVLVISLPAVYFSARALPEVQAAWQDDLTSRALVLIRSYGVVAFAQLASDLDIPLAQVDELVDTLLHTQKLNGAMDARLQWVYTAAALAERQRFLLELLRLQGRVRLSELERRLNVPPELLRDWIYQLVQRGQFSGSMNWQQGWLYSSAAQQIGKDSRCPHCGGALSPGPANTILCLHCGAEILRQIDY